METGTGRKRLQRSHVPTLGTDVATYLQGHTCPRERRLPTRTHRPIFFLSGYKLPYGTEHSTVGTTAQQCTALPGNLRLQGLCVSPTYGYTLWSIRRLVAYGYGYGYGLSQNPRLPFFPRSPILEGE